MEQLEAKVLALSPDEFGRYPSTKEALEVAIAQLQAAKDANKAPTIIGSIPAAWVTTPKRTTINNKSY